MITTDLDSPRFRDITSSTEDAGCEAGLELVSRLRDADAVKWTVAWKSGLDRWLPHDDEPQTEAEGVLTALAAPFVHTLEEIPETKESGGLKELRGLVKAFSNERRYWCDHGFDDKKWSAKRGHAKAEREVLDFLTKPANSPATRVSTRPVNSGFGENESRCSVLIEGVEEPLSLDDALAIATNWEAVNERRMHLIEKKAAKQITEDESAELKDLQRLAWARRQMVMPLPVKELAAIEDALRRMQLWREK